MRLQLRNRSRRLDVRSESDDSGPRATYLATLVSASLFTLGLGTCDGSSSSRAQVCVDDAECRGAICELGRCMPRPTSALEPVRLPETRQGAWLHRGSSLFAFASERLARVFRLELGERVVAAPCLLADGRALVITTRGKAVVLDSDGRIAARADLGFEVLSTPASDLLGRVLVASSDGELRVLDAELRVVASGSLGARVEGPLTRLPMGLFAVPTRGISIVTGGAVELRRIPTPTVLRAGISFHPDGFLVVGTPEGRLLAHRLDGTAVFDSDAGASVESAAAIGADGSILVGNDLGQLRVFDRTGVELRRFVAELDVRATPTVLEGGRIALLTLDGHARILDASLAVQTDLDLLAPLEAQALVDARGRILLGGHDGRLHLLANDGHELRAENLGADIHVIPSLLPDGTLLVVADDGAVHGFR